jgi:two-component system, cell cycle response regulator DivK
MQKSVMIVEDNELNMKLFHDLLEAHGYHTICTREASRRSISPASTVPI